MRLASIFLTVLAASVTLSSLAAWGITYATSYSRVTAMSDEFTRLAHTAVDDFQGLVSELISNSTDLMQTITEREFQAMDLSLDLVEDQMKSASTNLVNYYRGAMVVMQQGGTTLIASFQAFLLNSITDFANVAFGFASALRLQLADQVKDAVRALLRERQLAVVRQARLHRLGVLDLTVPPDTLPGPATCLLLGLLCEASEELEVGASVFIGTAQGSYYRCLARTSAAMLVGVASANGTVQRVFFQWNATNASLDEPTWQERCLHEPAWLRSVSDTCYDSPACGSVCGFDPHCRDWYALQVNRSGPPELGMTNLYLDFSSMLPVLTLSYPMYDNAQASNRSLLGVAGVDFFPSRIRGFLQTLNNTNNTTVLLLRNDSGLTILGNSRTGPSCNATDELSDLSLFQSCDPQLLALATCLLPNINTTTRVFTCALGPMVWDIFPSSTAGLSYFVVVGMDFDDLYGTIRDVGNEALARLETLSLNQSAAIANVTQQGLDYVVDIERANLQQLNATRHTLQAVLLELWGRSQRALNTSHCRSQARLDSLTQVQYEAVARLEEFSLAVLATNVGWTVAIVVGTLLLIMSVGTYGTMSVTRSLGRLVVILQRAAHLEVCPEEDFHISGVTEVQSLQANFLVLMTRLMHYRSFLPAALYDQPDPENTSSAQSLKEEATHALRRLNSIQRRRSSASALTRDESSGCGVHRPLSVVPAPILPGACDSPSYGSPVSVSAFARTKMERKAIAAMVVNLMGFKATLSTIQEAGMEGLLNQYVSLVHEAVAKARGNVDAVLGDQILVTFNAHIPCSDPTTAVAGAALEIQAFLAVHPELRQQVQMGLSAGPAFAGNTGYVPFKAMVTVGAPLKVAGLLAHLLNFGEGAVLVDPAIEERVKYTFKLRPVDLVYLPQLGSYYPIYARNVRVFLLQCRKELQEDEWLYQLDQGSPIGAWETTFNQLTTAKTADGAVSCLQQYVAANPDDPYAARLRARMADWRPLCGVPLCEGAEPPERQQHGPLFR